MTGKHVVIALENEPYPHDRRVRQEAETLRDAGYGSPMRPDGFGFTAREEMLDGVQVRRYRRPLAGWARPDTCASMRSR